MLRSIRQILTRRRRHDDDAHAATRGAMVERDLRGRGIMSPRVLDCMARIPRERFVDVSSQAQAYSDRALAIDCQQTISQPYIVALMSEMLDVQPESRVLEIGTGSGYQTAVVAELSKEVVSIERHAALSRGAQRTLSDCNYTNITFVIGDGSLGWPARAPYDRILVAAAVEAVPPALIEQLADGGLLVAPIGSRSGQRLHLVRKDGKHIRCSEQTACRFVPLIGEHGFKIRGS